MGALPNHDTVKSTHKPKKIDSTYRNVKDLPNKTSCAQQPTIEGVASIY